MFNILDNLGDVRQTTIIPTTIIIIENRIKQQMCLKEFKITR